MENLEKETLIQKIKDLEVILKEMDLKIETAKREVKMLENNKENLLETKGTLELIKIEGGKNSRSFD